MLYSEFLLSRINYLRLDATQKRGLIRYCQRIEHNGLPPIINLQHLGIATGVGAGFLAAFLRDPSRYYRSYTLPKRRGGYRTISVPRPYLMHAQRWISESILAPLPIHIAATGFRAGGSIRGNAEAHLGGARLLKMDIEDFFGTVSRQRTETVFLNVGYSAEVSHILSQIVTFGGNLPQGAPTSPALSNIVLMDFDVSIAAYCAERGLTYTRYADDIAISGDEIGPAQIDHVNGELLMHGFLPAFKKTLIAKAGQKKIVTGVSISSGRVRLPRDQRRRLRQELYFTMKFGVAEHAKRLGRPDPIYQQRLLGHFVHWSHIEPENETARRGVRQLKAKRTRRLTKPKGSDGPGTVAP